MSTTNTRPLAPEDAAALHDCLDRLCDDFSTENVAALLIVISMLVRDL